MSVRPVALVTGAGRGIGRGIAAALAQHGYDVVVHDRDATCATADAVAEVQAAGARAAVVHADIADLAAHGPLLDAAAASFGRLDCLVNNAGVSVLARGDLLDVTAESFDRCIAVNARAGFFLARGFARMLLRTEALPGRHRAIVFVTSSNAEAASLNRGEYCVSKAAAAMAARLFALRLAPAGIGVYDVRPGIIATEMTLRSKDRYDAMIAAGTVPMPRWGTVADVGQAVATLATGALPYTVGLPVTVDGGLVTPHY